MDILATVSAGAQLVPFEIEESLVQPFVAAVSATFAEMAGTELVPLGSFRRARVSAIGDFSAMIRFTDVLGGFVLGFPRSTALAVSKRILANVPGDIDESLLGDCLGEIANVVAGQAKALLSSTPHHFAFSTPTVTVGTLPEMQADLDCLAVVFRGELGDFALQICTHI